MLSAEEQDIYNRLKAAGVSANSEFGQSIIESTQALHEQARAVSAQVEIMDTFRTEASSALSEVVLGTKSVGDAFKDMFDSIAQRITQMIADRWIEQLFGQMGSTNTGQSSAGGWISQIFGALFGGGGKASGGSVWPGGLYPVNERGTEMLSIGNRDYLMMGKNAGSITPNHALRGMGGGQLSQVNNFNFAAPTDDRTQTQVAARVGFETRRATTRNR